MTRITAVLLSFISALFSVHGQTAAGTATLHLSLHPDSRERYAHLRIGPTFLGRLYRGRSRSFRVITGRELVLCVYRIDRRSCLRLAPERDSFHYVRIGLPPAGKHPNHGEARISIRGAGTSSLSVNGKKQASAPDGDDRLNLTVPAGRAVIRAFRSGRAFHWLRHLRPDHSYSIRIP